MSTKMPDESALNNATPLVIDARSVRGVIARCAAGLSAHAQPAQRLLAAMPVDLKLHILDWIGRTIVESEASIENWRDLIGRSRGDSDRRPVLLYRSLQLSIGAELAALCRAGDGMLAFIAS